MGIMMTFAIETKKSGERWKLHDEDGIYDKDGLFYSYLGSTHSSEVKSIFPVNIEHDAYEAFYKELSSETRKVLGLIGGEYPSYGMSTRDVFDILDMPREVFEKIYWTRKIDYLKKMNIFGIDARLIIVFD